MEVLPKTERVLVTGARLPAALEILRAVAGEGAPVWAGDSLRFTTAGLSRSAAGRVFFPAPAFDVSGFRSQVLSAISRLGITLVIPVSEEIFFLASLREELAARGARLFAPELALLRALHSKWQVREAADGCGFLLPETRRVSDATSLAAALAALPEGVLKPEFSRGAYETFFLPNTGAQGVVPTPERPWLVQERVRGRELTTYSVAVNGAVLAHACYEPRYRVGAGASLYFEPRVSPAAEAAARAFARKHSFTGQFSFDVMETEAGLALLECNPRATSGAHLCAGLGAALLGRSSVSAAKNLEPVVAKLAVAAFHGAHAVREGRFGSLVSDLSRARDSCFRLSDPLPALGIQLATLELLVRSRRWPVEARHAFTYDLEWNGGAV